MQVLGAAHAASHAPQCALLVVMSTSTPPQTASPGAGAHSPAPQRVARGHLLPQKPQFELSLPSLTHRPPQFVSLLEQES
jgi:hypothetical protein